MIFDKSVLLSCAGVSDGDDVIKFSVTFVVDYDSPNQTFIVLDGKRETSTNPNCWVDELLLDEDGLLAIAVHVPFPIDTDIYDVNYAGIEVVIGGISLKPFTDLYDYDDDCEGDLENSHYMFPLRGQLDDPVAIPALSDLKIGTYQKVSFKIKGLKAAIAGK